MPGKRQISQEKTFRRDGGIVFRWRCVSVIVCDLSRDWQHARVLQKVDAHHLTKSTRSGMLRKQVALQQIEGGRTSSKSNAHGYGSINRHKACHGGDDDGFKRRSPTAFDAVTHVTHRRPLCPERRLQGCLLFTMHSRSQRRGSWEGGGMRGELLVVLGQQAYARAPGAVGDERTATASAQHFKTSLTPFSCG